MTNDGLTPAANPTFVLRALEKALTLQAPLARAHVARLRRKSPEASPQEILRRLNRDFRTGTVSTGAGVGAAAAAPAVGTGVAISLAGGEFVTFLGASVLYVLARSEVYGMRTSDVERQRFLVTAVLLGESASSAIPTVAERTGKHWARAVIRTIPRESIVKVNKVLGRNFVTKYGTKQGVIVLGKVVPFGIGALIGGTMNGLVSHGIIRSSDRAFGPVPTFWGPIDTDEGDVELF
jgi:hypothetical protein